MEYLKVFNEYRKYIIGAITLSAIISAIVVISAVHGQSIQDQAAVVQALYKVNLCIAGIYTALYMIQAAMNYMSGKNFFIPLIVAAIIVSLVMVVNKAAIDYYKEKIRTTR